MGLINGFYGKVNNVNYVLLKVGMMGLLNIVVIEGKDVGVISNVIILVVVMCMFEGIDIL